MTAENDRKVALPFRVNKEEEETSMFRDTVSKNVSRVVEAKISSMNVARKTVTQKGGSLEVAKRDLPCEKKDNLLRFTDRRALD